MLLIRDIFYCKPGKTRQLVDKFLAMKKLPQPKGMGNVRVVTDVSADRYWTVVSEMEVESLEEPAFGEGDVFERVRHVGSKPCRGAKATQ